MISKYISQFTIDSLGLKDDTEYIIKRVSAIDLLSTNRIDIVAKYMFILFEIKNVKSDLAYNIYKKHIEIFSEGRFYEPGSETKNTFERFIIEFKEIYSSLKKDGFDKKISLIPLGKDNVLINGAHRTSAAIFLGLDIDVIQLLETTGPYYDYKFFERNNMKREYLDFMALNYLKLTKRNVYAICIWPKAVKQKKEKILEEIIRNNTQIVYKKRIKFNINGLKSLTIHLYDNQEWIGNPANNYCGADGKMYECCEDDDTIFYFVEGGELDEILSLKDKLRIIYNIGKHSLHITDTTTETISVAEYILNDNSINAFNYGNLEKVSMEIEMLKKYYSDKFISYVMNPLYTLKVYGYNVKVDEPLVETNTLSKDVEYDINDYFYYMGVKFISPQYAIELVDTIYKDKFMSIINNQRVPIQVKVYEKIARFKYLMKRNVKVYLRRVGALDYTYKMLGKIRSFR